MSWIMTTQQIPVAVTSYLTSFTTSPYTMLLVLNLILLITGCLMEVNAAVILLGPIMLPILLTYGMIVNLAIGLLTPPLGINLFVANGLRKDVAFKDVVRYSVPFLCLLGVVLLAITFMSQLVLFTANFLG